MKPFTVVGYYEDNGQTYVEHVDADDWIEAMRKAVVDYPEPTQHSDLVIVSVFEGHHMDQTEHDSCVAACDVPGVAQCDCCDVFMVEEESFTLGDETLCTNCYNKAG